MPVFLFILFVYVNILFYICNVKQKQLSMTTIISNSEYRVDFNGVSTYMIVDSSEQCIMIKDSLRKAKNYFNKVSKLAGL